MNVQIVDKLDNCMKYGIDVKQGIIVNQTKDPRAKALEGLEVVMFLNDREKAYELVAVLTGDVNTIISRLLPIFQKKKPDVTFKELKDIWLIGRFFPRVIIKKEDFQQQQLIPSSK